MKRIISVLLATALFTTTIGLTIVGYANDEHIPGFIDCMDNIMLNKNLTPELEARMRETNQEAADDNFYNSYLPGLKESGKLNGIKDLESYEKYLYKNYVLSEDVDYDSGYKVYLLHTNNYMEQYASSRVFGQLINNSEYYWNVRYLNSSSSGVKMFHSDGTIAYNHWKDRNDRTNTGSATKEMIDFIQDYDRIERLLKDAGETQVNEIRIVYFLTTQMYIKGEKDEYLIRLNRWRVPPEEQAYAASYDIDWWQGDIVAYKLYTAQEVIGILSKPYNDKALAALGNPNKGRIPSDNMLKIKPTFTTEAETLKSEGLLQGNEKGLDLLKPLTRIEATTLLVRTLGLDNVPTSSESQFTDISNDNWGKKYANIAKDKGLVKGIGDGKFAPDELVTDNQFATLVLRGAKEPDFNWETAIQLLIEKGIITEENAKTMDLFTRGDMAKIIYEARAKGLL